MLSATGQNKCYDQEGSEISCHGNGQDGEYRTGVAAPEPRFELLNETVRDRLTDLIWSRDANPNGFPSTWQEALDTIRALNEDQYLGHHDWRLPNRAELRSLMHYQAKNPALPDGHPFTNVFLGWCWTSTTAAINPAYAWYIHLEGARMFYGRKEQYYLFWPVRGKGNGLLHQTGQRHCYDSRGKIIPCSGSGQDGEHQYGRPRPEPRYQVHPHTVVDRLTNLCWTRQADNASGPVNWREALTVIDYLNQKHFAGRTGWRLPNINELESLVDCTTASPALPATHPFTDLHDAYWSATTSFFETAWAWVLYLEKGACGVGHKPGKTFYVWGVCDATAD